MSLDSTNRKKKALLVQNKTIDNYNTFKLLVT